MQLARSGRHAEALLGGPHRVFRLVEGVEGDGLIASAIRGTSEVRSAVVASVLTSIAVFFPMVFVEGIAGEAFGDLGLAVVISLLASLAVALMFIPMLASRRGWSPRSWSAAATEAVAAVGKSSGALAR